MRVTSLKLTNLRAIEAAEFHFQPGFNLIVGVNGVGKTSVLQALGLCLSAVIKNLNQLRFSGEALALEDIRVGADALTIECGVQFGNAEHHYLIHKRAKPVCRKRRGQACRVSRCTIHPRRQHSWARSPR